MMGSRKFTIAIICLVLGALFPLLCWLDKELINLGIPFYTFLGGIGSAFFAANFGEYWQKAKAPNVPNPDKPV